MRRECSKAHLVHVSSLSGQAYACIQPVMRARGEGATVRLPFSRFLSAAGIGFLDHPVPAGESGSPCGGLPAHPADDGPRRGYHVAHDRDTAGKGARSTPGLRCPHGCAELSSRRLPLYSGQSYTLVTHAISEVFCDEASSRVHCHSPVSLSLACSPRMVRGPLGLNPELRTPRLLTTHVRAGTDLRTLARNYTIGRCRRRGQQCSSGPLRLVPSRAGLR